MKLATCTGTLCFKLNECTKHFSNLTTEALIDHLNTVLEDMGWNFTLIPTSKPNLFSHTLIAWNEGRMLNVRLMTRSNVWVPGY